MFRFFSDFRDKFDDIKEVINAANFVAIDCEFTGLSQDNTKAHQYDSSPSEYFHKICQQTRYAFGKRRLSVMLLSRI